MRASTLFLSAILGTSALAHPSFFHSHQKRHPEADPKTTVKSWTENGVKYTEYVTVKEVTVNGEKKDDSAPQSAAEPQPEVVQVVQKSKNPKPAPKAPKAEFKAAEPASEPAKKEPEPEKKEESSPSTSSSGGCSGQADTIGGGEDAWSGAHPPCSDGQTVLEVFNDLRGKWRSGLPAYEWDDLLASTARTDTLVTQNNANVMKHPDKLAAGVGGQCIASSNDPDGTGKKSDLKGAILLWLCEIPSGGLCPGGVTPGGSTGHADIIKDPGRAKVGCYFLWRGGASQGKGALGHLTCNFSY